MEKESYNRKELADLLDVGETTLDNQIIPVVRAVLAEILDETVKTLIDQKERIEFLEEENLELHRRLRILEAELFPDLAAAQEPEAEFTETAMVDLESVLGLELEGALPAVEAKAEEEAKAEADNPKPSKNGGKKA
ncbi:MAG: hypothetical protein K9L59_02840 [Desulfobacterales bacterium]|nr:hypothetical protein [Desulfobacterales bacterium]